MVETQPEQHSRAVEGGALWYFHKPEGTEPGAGVKVWMQKRKQDCELLSWKEMLLTSLTKIFQL